MEAFRPHLSRMVRSKWSLPLLSSNSSLTGMVQKPLSTCLSLPSSSTVRTGLALREDCPKNSTLVAQLRASEASRTPSTASSGLSAAASMAAALKPAVRLWPRAVRLATEAGPRLASKTMTVLSAVSSASLRALTLAGSCGGPQSPPDVWRGPPASAHGTTAFSTSDSISLKRVRIVLV